MSSTYHEVFINLYFSISQPELRGSLPRRRYFHYVFEIRIEHLLPTEGSGSTSVYHIEVVEQRCGLRIKMFSKWSEIKANWKLIREDSAEKASLKDAQSLFEKELDIPSVSSPERMMGK